jgi:hypothetical protein
VDADVLRRASTPDISAPVIVAPELIAAKVAAIAGNIAQLTITLSVIALEIAPRAGRIPITAVFEIMAQAVAIGPYVPVFTGDVIVIPPQINPVPVAIARKQCGRSGYARDSRRGNETPSNSHLHGRSPFRKALNTGSHYEERHRADMCFNHEQF